jgi:hypothetical protein
MISAGGAAGKEWIDSVAAAEDWKESRDSDFVVVSGRDQRLEDRASHFHCHGI